MFQDDDFEIRKKSGTLIAAGKRTNENIYHLKENDGYCFITQINESWLWHRRMCHSSFDSLVQDNYSSSCERPTKDHQTC